jgi:hypothetical protein
MNTIYHRVVRFGSGLGNGNCSVGRGRHTHQNAHNGQSYNKCPHVSLSSWIACSFKALLTHYQDRKKYALTGVPYLSVSCCNRQHCLPAAHLRHLPHLRHVAACKWRRSAATLTVTLYALTDMEYPLLRPIRIKHFDHFLVDA